MLCSVYQFVSLPLSVASFFSFSSFLNPLYLLNLSKVELDQVNDKKGVTEITHPCIFSRCRPIQVSRAAGYILIDRLTFSLSLTHMLTYNTNCHSLTSHESIRWLSSQCLQMKERRVEGGQRGREEDQMRSVWGCGVLNPCIGYRRM